MPRDLWCEYCGFEKLSTDPRTGRSCAANPSGLHKFVTAEENKSGGTIFRAMRYICIIYLLFHLSKNLGDYFFSQNNKNELKSLHDNIFRDFMDVMLSNSIETAISKNIFSENLFGFFVGSFLFGWVYELGNLNNWNFIKIAFSYIWDIFYSIFILFCVLSVGIGGIAGFIYCIRDLFRVYVFPPQQYKYNNNNNSNYNTQLQQSSLNNNYNNYNANNTNDAYANNQYYQQHTHQHAYDQNQNQQYQTHDHHNYNYNNMYQSHNYNVQHARNNSGSQLSQLQHQYQQPQQQQQHQQYYQYQQY